MSNFAAPAAYPYGNKGPFPHDDANALIEQLLKTINADEGSAHQPTGDIAWSGASGHGMTFADLFPFAGELDVTDGLLFTSATSGLVSFGALVPVRVYGSLTIKASVGGLVIENGASETVHGGFTLASNSTGTFAGPISLKGTLTVENTGGGGPGGIVIESDAVFDIGSLVARVVSGGVVTWRNGSFLLSGTTASATWLGVWNYGASAVVDFVAGSTFTIETDVTVNDSGTLTMQDTSAFTVATGATAFFAGVTTYSGDNGYQVLRSNTAPDADATVDLWKQDVLKVPDITGNRTYTLAHPPSNRVVRSVVHWPTSSTNHSLDIYDGATFLYCVDSSSGGTDIATLTFLYNGSRWVLESAKHRPRVYLAGSDGDVSALPAWRYDVITVPAFTGNRAWDFAKPPTNSDVIKDIVIRWSNGGAHILTLATNGGADFAAVTGTSTVAGTNLTIGYDGVSYFAKGYFT